jgi:hypothetical protein
MGGVYYKYVLKIKKKILTDPTRTIFLLTGRALRDPATWLSLLFESKVEGSTGLSISEKTGAKELYVATSRECSYQRNGKKVRGEKSIIKLFSPRLSQKNV